MYTEGQAPQERRQLLRLHRRSRIRLRHRRGLDHARRTSSASSPPSRFRRCCATSTPSRSARTSVNPKITTSVIFTGDWSMPVKEAEATNSLIDQGADVVTCSRRLAQGRSSRTPKRRGVFSTGYHANQSALAPKGYLTGAEWNWAQGLHRLRREGQEGQAVAAPRARWLQRGLHQDVAVRRGSLRRDQSQGRRGQGSSWRQARSSSTARSRTTTGKEIIAANVERGQTDIELEKMGYLVEGVKGAVH